MRLLHNRHEYRNGKPYDPKTFKRQRIVRAVDDIIRDIMKHGHALIPLKERDAIKNRLRLAGVKVSYRQDGGRVKVTPKQE